MLCPHCHAPNADDARFCGACGKATSVTEPVAAPDLREAPAMVGREIAGRFRILAMLGEGGMGAVFKAEQMSLKRTVALKLLRPDVTVTPMLLRRFNAEAEAVAKLKHPNTVQIYDFGQDRDGTLFISMELVEGRSLRQVMHAEGPLPLRRALAIATQVAASLADAHARTVIHRDLKPDNVMLTDRGRTRDHVTVLDFGIAKLHERGTQLAMTQAGDMLGTPQYMAPEQIRAETIDGRTDVYALGCMLYEMVTARLPFEAPTIMALLSKHLIEQAPPPSLRRPDLGLPPAIDELVMSAMAKDPAHRPSTMDALAERLQELLAMQPASPSGPRSAVSAIGGIATPHGPSYAFHPPTPPPAGPAAYGANATPAAQPFAPHGTLPPAATPFTAPGSRRPGMRVIAVVAGVLAVGAAMTAAYVLKRRTTTAAVAPAPAPPVAEHSPPSPTAEDEGDDAERGPTGIQADPWGGGSDPSLLLPASARLVPPAGFRVVSDTSASKQIADEARQLSATMTPIPAGSDDPDVIGRQLAATWGIEVEAVSSMYSHGATRFAIAFSGVSNGVAMTYIGVGFLAPSYRIAVLVSAPATAVEQAGFEQWLQTFLDRNVVLPSA